jgi:hypothetical protein
LRLLIILLVGATLAVATSAQAVVKTDPQRAEALSDRAVAAIDDAYHEVLGHALRCSRVRHGHLECGFAVVIRYDDGAMRTCAGSLVVHHHRARFRNGLSCQLGDAPVDKPVPGEARR